EFQIAWINLKAVEHADTTVLRRACGSAEAQEGIEHSQIGAASLGLSQNRRIFLLATAAGVPRPVPEGERGAMKSTNRHSVTRMGIQQSARFHFPALDPSHASKTFPPANERDNSPEPKPIFRPDKPIIHSLIYLGEHTITY